MKLKKLSALLLGLLLSGIVIAQDEVYDAQTDDTLAVEENMDMDIPAVSVEEMAELIRQDCQEMAADEGLEGDAAGAYIDSCAADIMAIDSDTDITTEADDEMVIADEEYAEVAVVEDGGEIPLVTE